MRKNKKKYNPVAAAKAAMRKAIIEAVGLSAWVSKNRVIPDKKKKADRERCKDVKE